MQRNVVGSAWLIRENLRHFIVREKARKIREEKSSSEKNKENSLNVQTTFFSLTFMFTAQVGRPRIDRELRKKSNASQLAGLTIYSRKVQRRPSEKLRTPTRLVATSAPVHSLT